MGYPVYQFGEFRLDSGAFGLLRDGHPLRLEKKPLELLMLLASSQGRLVTRAEIAERLWGNEVFVDTEHGINTAVRKIRAALRDDPERPRFVQTVTGMGYRFVAPTELVEEELPAKPQAHAAEELSPEPQPVATPDGAAIPHRIRWDSIWVSLGVLAAILFAVGAIASSRSLLGKRRARNGVDQPIRSVAVLPLANYSGDPGQEYFADGMTDELITMLARNSTLRVPSRTSVMHYKSANVSLAEVAKALGVDAIVEGSVSRTSGQVHLNLQLIRVENDSHLWADSFDRSPGDVAALSNEAAHAIAARLNSASAARAAARYVGPDAHDAYLQGHYLWSVGRNEEAGRSFERAVALQPDYALGWTGVSQYYSAGAFFGELDPRSALPKAEAAAETAVSLDETLAQTHSMLAAAGFFRSWDGQRALREVSRATELDPRSSEAYHLHALILSAMGRSQEALDVQDISTAVDPVTHPAAKAEILFYARQYDRSLAEAEMRLRDFPDAKDLLHFLAELHHLRGEDAQAAQFTARLEAAPGDNRPNQAVLEAFRSGGYRGILQQRLAELKRLQTGHYVSPTALARVYAQLGNRDQTLSLLEQALRTHDPMLLFASSDPAYDAFHDDARYRSLMKEIGLKQAQPERS